MGTALTGTQVKNSYGDVLQMGNTGGGVTASLQQVLDGLGNPTALYLAAALVRLAGTVNGPTSGDWTINLDHAGNDIIFQVGGTEYARISHGGGFQFSGSFMRTQNGVDWVSQVRSLTSLGSSNLNNFDAGSAPVQRWAAQAAINVTGMVPDGGGLCIMRRIWNVGSFNITLTNQDSSSTAANQWLTTTGASLVLAPNKCVLTDYDPTTGAWRATLLP